MTSTRVLFTTASAATALLLAACSAGEALSPSHTAEATALVSLSAQNPRCTPDSKLIGLIEISKEDRPGTWWFITREGMDKSGLTDYLGTIEAWFGADYADLDEALDALLAPVHANDANANGVICAYSVRGTLANYRDPNINNLIFRVRDDNP